MSGAAGDDLSPVEIARKLRRYGHLMPMAGAHFIDKVQSGSPPFVGCGRSGGCASGGTAAPGLA